MKFGGNAVDGGSELPDWLCAPAVPCDQHVKPPAVNRQRSKEKQVLELRELGLINERCMQLQQRKAKCSRGSSSSSKKAAVGAAEGSHHSAAGSSHGCGGGVVSGLLQQQTQRGQPHRASSRGRRKGTGSSSACPYLSVAPGVWEEFTDLVLAAPVDVEELAAMGRKKKLSHAAAPLVKTLVGAYYERFKLLLNPSNAQHLQQLLNIAAALHSCLRAAGKTSSDGTGCQPAAAGAAGTTCAAVGRVMAVNDMLFDLGLDNINMFDLARWVKVNKIAFKVAGYTQLVVARSEGQVEPQARLSGQHPKKQLSGATAAMNSQQQQQQQPYVAAPCAHDGVSAIHSFIAFLLSLTNADEDGRIVIEPPAASTAAAAAGVALGSVEPPHPSRADKGSSAVRGGGRLRYVLLNAAGHFGRLVSAARSVLLVSGTLAPREGLQAQLFPNVEPSRIRHFECGHVVPAEQLLAVSIGSGPSGRALDFRHESRSSIGVIDELGQLLLNLCAVVPEGLVVFVPSFGYLELLVSRWSSSSLLARLAQRKQLFK
eukprot:gene7938-8134_t